MPFYTPGNEPSKLKIRLNNFFSRIDELYPDKNVSGLHNEHKKLGERLTGLYRELGYSSGYEMMTAYGYNYVTKSMLSKDERKKQIIEELKKRYPDGSPYCQITDLKNANKDIENAIINCFITKEELIAEGVLQTKNGAMKYQLEQKFDMLREMIQSHNFENKKWNNKKQIIEDIPEAQVLVTEINKACNYLKWDFRSEMKERGFFVDKQNEKANAAKNAVNNNSRSNFELAYICGESTRCFCDMIRNEYGIANAEYLKKREKIAPGGDIESAFDQLKDILIKVRKADISGVESFFGENRSKLQEISDVLGYKSYKEMLEKYGYSTQICDYSDNKNDSDEELFRFARQLLSEYGTETISISTDEPEVQCSYKREKQMLILADSIDAVRKKYLSGLAGSIDAVRMKYLSEPSDRTSTAKIRSENLQQGSVRGDTEKLSEIQEICSSAQEQIKIGISNINKFQELEKIRSEKEKIERRVQERQVGSSDIYDGSEDEVLMYVTILVDKENGITRNDTEFYECYQEDFPNLDMEKTSELRSLVYTQIMSGKRDFDEEFRHLPFEKRFKYAVRNLVNTCIEAYKQDEFKNFIEVFSQKWFIDDKKRYCNEVEYLFKEMCEELDEQLQLVDPNWMTFDSAKCSLCISILNKPDDDYDPDSQFMIDMGNVYGAVQLATSGIFRISTHLNHHFTVYWNATTEEIWRAASQNNVFDKRKNNVDSDAKDIANRCLRIALNKINCEAHDDYNIDQSIITEKPETHESKDLSEPTVKKGGCYIATAVYGSYDCPQVWILRRFRDYRLAKTWYGRAFIRTYYSISPTLVKWFGKTHWFKRLWKYLLDTMVTRLKKEGFYDTPYNDRKF